MADMIFKYGAMAMYQMYHTLICTLNLSLIMIYCIINKYLNKKIGADDTLSLLIFSMNLIGILSNLFQSILDFSLNKIFFDRLLQYENTEQERKNIDNNKIIKFCYGKIKFENICMRYQINSELT